MRGGGRHETWQAPDGPGSLSREARFFAQSAKAGRSFEGASYWNPPVKCGKPLVLAGGQVVGCGQCLPCRIGRRRTWSHRLELEARGHKHVSFLTLTYADEHLPKESNGLATLSPEDLRNFLKRVRKMMSPVRLRFFAVGEYGAITLRPHYHLVIFGYPPCRHYKTRAWKLYPKDKSLSGSCCTVCDAVNASWGLGQIQVGTFSPESAQYVAGYVVKKMKDRMECLLEGRHPEFARMSNRPGIGAEFMDEVASEFLKYDMSDQVDVPTSLQGERGSLKPLGRYLVKRLRTRVGRDEKTPQAVVEQRDAEVFPVRLAARSSEKGLKTLLAEEQAGKLARAEALEQIFKQRREL